MWALFNGWLAWTVKAGWVVLALLLVRRILGRRLSAQGLFLLWGLLAARLVIPQFPEAPWSVQQGARVLNGAPLPGLGSGTSLNVSPVLTEAETWSSVLGDPRFFLPVLWLAGVFWLLTRITAAGVQARRWVVASRPVTDPRILALKSAGEQAMGMSRRVELRWSSRVDGPVLCGWFRPAILLPEAWRAELTDERLRNVLLRNVLLHELAHVARRDGVWHLGASLAVAAHWPNPLMWIAYRAFRDDLEMACDAKVLEHLSTERRRDYGHTLLDLGVKAPETLTAAAFAVVSRRQLTRRIEMIARFRPKTRWSQMALVALVGALGALFLTDLPVTAAAAEQQRIRELSPTEIAKIFAQKLGDKNDHNAVAVASELSKIWQANQDQADEIEVAMVQEAELAAARGNVELSGMLTKMIRVLAAESGRQATLPSDAETRAKTTLQLLRQAGSALHARFGSPPQSATQAVPTTLDWQQCPAVGMQRLRKLADEQGWGPLPAFDAWGHELEYCVSPALLAGEEGEAQMRFGVRSPGLDGSFSGGTYDIGAFDVAEESADVVWVDGYFATWPELPAGS